MTAAAFANYYTQKPQFDTPTLLKNAVKPTLVIMASEDTLVPKLPEKMQALANQPHVKTLTLDGADHLFVDLANEDAAAAIVEFMQE